MTAAHPAADGGARQSAVLPPALRLPAAAGAAVFAVAVGTTQVALHATNHQADRQVEQLGQVYLDGLAASIRAGLETGDAADVAERFARAFGEQRGVAERALFAFGPDGRLLARAGDPGLPDSTAAAMEEGWRLDAASGIAWAARQVRGAERQAGRVVAALDVAPMLAARRRLSWIVVLVDLALAALFAAATWLVLHRFGAPLRALVSELSEGARRPPAHLPDAVIAAADPRSAAVLRAYNRMADAVRERERLAGELAEQEQAAALGRLAATIAHEVRNPLGGLATAVSTLRRFGDDPAVREESLAFLDRGIGALDRIVTGTLDLYRPAEDRRLTRADLEDLAGFVRPAAAARGVTLRFGLDLPAGEIAQGAVGLRQVLLNLLLNACEATPAGGTVELHARLDGGDLLCEVADGGPGLSAGQARRLTGGVTAEAEARRLGLGVVVGLLGQLDARASVSQGPSGGTVVRLAIPLDGRAAGAGDG